MVGKNPRPVEFVRVYESDGLELFLRRSILGVASYLSVPERVVVGMILVPLAFWLFRFVFPVCITEHVAGISFFFPYGSSVFGFVERTSM